MRILTYEEALAKAAAYCSLSEKCESEVTDKLKAWGVQSADKDKIIERLRQERFIDDVRYAEAYVKDKFRYNKWGKIKISLMLRSKGLDDSDISAAINLIDDDEYEETLYQLLKAKLKNISYKDEYERQGKLTRFAQGRGFENRIISSVIRRII